MADKRYICAICGLFGIHRNHDLTTKAELQFVNLKLIEQINQRLANYAFQEEFGNYETAHALLAAKFKDIIKESKFHLLEAYKVSS